MTFESLSFKLGASISDRIRDAAIPLPAGIACRNNIPYTSGQLLDVYYPDGTRAPLPTIVSIHGGGYVYGNKEIYRRYGMDLARRGFAFVNFNYRLAPRARFPAPLEDTDAVMEWVCRSGEEYHLDPERVFLVGDSAGAQLASQYAAITRNPDYAALFQVKRPPVSIRALALNCGRYDLAAMASEPRKGLMADYFGREMQNDDPRLQVMNAIGDNYPPAFIATSCRDFMREYAHPMYEHLNARGVQAVLRCYGSEEDGTVAHVFHVNIRLPDATRCNDEECAFFQNFLD